MKNKLAKTVRIATIPPVAAVLLILSMPEQFSGAGRWRALFFLALLPTLAYPVCRAVPALRRRGRTAERTLAVILSVTGYTAGAVSSVCLRESREVQLVYLVYLASGLLIAVFSFLLHIRGSGHASGVAGPIAMLAFHGIPGCLGGLPVLALVFWSSLTLGRHSWSQLVLGSVFPVLALALLGPAML